MPKELVIAAACGIYLVLCALLLWPGKAKRVEPGSKLEQIMIGGVFVAFALFALLIGWSVEVVIVIVIVGVACVVSDHNSEKQKKESAERYKQEQEEKIIKQFCDDCKKYGITDLQRLDSEEKKLRLELIEKKCGYSRTDPKIIQGFERMNREQAQRLEEQKQWEQKEFEKLTYYARFHGRNKPVAMFNDLANKLRGRKASYIPTQKESDGAIMAGIASGIGGTVPALMSLSRTAQNNETVRQENDVINALNVELAGRDADARILAGKYEKLAGELAIKLVGGTKQEAFEHLKFSEVHVNASATGSITVDAEVRMDYYAVTVSDKPGFIDGFVIAEIYDGERKIGEAKMVFPAYGSQYYEISPGLGIWTRDGWPVKLKGICLFCGEKGKKYTVKFVPGDLWIMEK